MSEPQDFDKKSESMGKGVGDSTKKLLKDLIGDLQDKIPPGGFKTAPKHELQEAQQPLIVPRSSTVLEENLQLEEGDDARPGNTTKRKIKDLWENLKNQMMDEETATGLVAKKTMQPKIEINQGVTPPLGKPKIVLSKEEHDKLKALRKMK